MILGGSGRLEVLRPYIDFKALDIRSHHWSMTIRGRELRLESIAIQLTGGLAVLVKFSPFEERAASGNRQLDSQSPPREHHGLTLLCQDGFLHDTSTYTFLDSLFSAAHISIPLQFRIDTVACTLDGRFHDNDDK